MTEKKGSGLVLIGVGTLLSSMPISGFLIGYLTDQWLDTAPIFMLSFGGLGFVGALLKIYKLLSKMT